MRTAIRSKTPLTRDQIRQITPSVLQTGQYKELSDKYVNLPTVQVLDALEKEGFLPFYAAQSMSRLPGKNLHAKHEVRLRRMDSTNLAVNQEFNEISLVNSSDGSSSYTMQNGVYRLVCSNGMIVCSESLTPINVRHSGKQNTINDVIEGSYRLVDEFELVNESKEEMKSITLDSEERRVFANSALLLKYDKPEEAPITSEALLFTRRMADHQNDLWTVFNKVQENLLKGGLRGRQSNGKPTRTREIRSVNENIRLNKALWQLAEGMKQLKA